MAMHETSKFLKIGGGFLILFLVVLLIFAKSTKSTDKTPSTNLMATKKIHNIASNDSAAESLDTLTAELASTKQQVTQITKDNATLKSQNDAILKQMSGSENLTTQNLSKEIDDLKNKLSHPVTGGYDAMDNATGSQSITTVPDLTQSPTSKSNGFGIFGDNKNPLQPTPSNSDTDNKPKIIPYYTIPANATAVRDRLMTSLVGRIPLKGTVTDPYPFKIVFSDDTLAANGLRVPHLKQMIVSGYSEGDLNLLSVRGWVTSLTFVFDDGTISTTTSNNNDIGHFTKENALGFLSDAKGNPFISGKLITNAPEYLGGNIALGAAQGAASAYAQAQTTNQTSILGSASSSVTGSAKDFVLGNAGIDAAKEAQQWWHDREENSFDAIYVPTTNEDGTPKEIAVNFAKEIQIDYNPKGRKIAYAHSKVSTVSPSLD